MHLFEKHLKIFQHSTINHCNSANCCNIMLNIVNKLRYHLYNYLDFVELMLDLSEKYLIGLELLLNWNYKKQVITG